MFQLYVSVMLIFVGYIEASIYVDFVIDFVGHQKRPILLTEYSCIKKESFLLMKNLSQQGYPINSISVDPSRVIYEEPFNKILYILRMNCPESFRILEKADDFKQFLFPYMWLLYFECDNFENSTQQDFEKYAMLVDSDVNLCYCDNDTIFIQKMYKRHRNTEILTENWANWTKTEGYIESDLEKNSIRRRGDLMGIRLNSAIVITNNDTYNHLTDKRDQHIDSITKVNYVLVEHLSDIVNISLNYSIQGTWGYNINGSEWSGMVGELTKNNADIGGTPLFFTSDRVGIIDYIAMTTPTHSKFIFREPKLSYVANVFTLPFDRHVWVSTISLVIISALVLRIIVKWENKSTNCKEQKISDNQPELEDSLEEAAFFSFGAVCQQGAPVIPSSVPGRIATIMIYVSLMFLYVSYSANIVALLQSSSDSIQTLEDLLKSRLEVGVDDTVFNHFYFTHSSDPIRRALYSEKVAPPGKRNRFMQIDLGVKRMREGLFAFHMETGPGYKIVGETFQESEKCGLKEIDFLNLIDPYLAIQKNSTYKKLLKIGLRKIHESGLQNREVALIYAKKPMCTSRGSSFISVGIVDCYPAAVVLAGGMIVAFMVLTVEYGIYYRYYIAELIKRKYQKTVIDNEPPIARIAWPFSN